MRMPGTVMLSAVGTVYIIMGALLAYAQIDFMIDAPEYVYILINPNTPGEYARVYVSLIVNVMWLCLAAISIIIGVAGVLRRNAHRGMAAFWIGAIIHAVLFTIASWNANDFAPLVTVLPMSFLYYQGARMNERRPDINKKTLF